MSWTYTVEEVPQEKKKDLRIRKNRRAWMVIMVNDSGQKRSATMPFLDTFYSEREAWLMASHWRDLSFAWKVYIDGLPEGVPPDLSEFCKWRKS